MPAFEILPIDQVQPGDRVCLDGPSRPIGRLAEVVRLDGEAGVVVLDSAGELLVALRRIKAVLRSIPLGSSHLRVGFWQERRQKAHGRLFEDLRRLLPDKIAYEAVVAAVTDYEREIGIAAFLARSVASDRQAGRIKPLGKGNEACQA